ncbi:hypothetical protein EYC54_18090 [Xanthomonas oryzae]|nr:hypothetical protein EYC54_18090 [Xanthomonas oryzae]
MPSSWPIAISSTPDSKPDCYSGWGDVGSTAHDRQQIRATLWPVYRLSNHAPSPPRRRTVHACLRATLRACLQGCSRPDDERHPQ